MLNILKNYITRPRLGRIEHLGLFSFWFGVWVFGAYFFPYLSYSTNFEFWLHVFLEAAFIAISILALVLNLIRRLHDLNLSGYQLLGNFLGILLVAPFKAGTPGDNAYGPQPQTPKVLYYLLIFFSPAVIFLLTYFGIPT